MPPEIVIIGAFTAVIALITAVLGLVREVNQRRASRQRDESISELELDLARLEYMQRPGRSIRTRRDLRRSREKEGAQLLRYLKRMYGEPSEPWYLRFTRRALPPRLREFEQEMKADREEALEYAAAHPNALHKWSDARETFSFALAILKYQILSITTERHKTDSVGTGSVIVKASVTTVRLGGTARMASTASAERIDRATQADAASE
jgi:uncharacterized membrane protein YidH (DUF202 family)